MVTEAVITSPPKLQLTRQQQRMKERELEAATKYDALKKELDKQGIAVSDKRICESIAVDMDMSISQINRYLKKANRIK